MHINYPLLDRGLPSILHKVTVASADNGPIYIRWNLQK
jgi:hypothetical protein